MKNNKGYTLIELLVAMAIFAIVMLEIFTMMNQSSKLYLNGTYEVELQTEAQQIVQQMEELLIDANVSVNCVSGVSGNSIEIINHNIDYYIDYVPSSNPSISYGNLYLSTAYKDDSGNITNWEADVLLAEYVESISLNMAEYETTSRITLDVVMNNGKYSYNTSKDIYLRNDIGTGGNAGYTPPSGAYDKELDVLRFRQYNLSALFGSEYSYEWASESAGEASSLYNLTHVGSYYLETKGSINNNFTNAYGDYLINACNAAGFVEFTIKISTAKVDVGADGFGLFVMTGTEPNSPHRSPVAVQGVYLGGADRVTWKIEVIGSLPNVAASSIDNYNNNANNTVVRNSGDADFPKASFSESFQFNFSDNSGYYRMQLDGSIRCSFDDDLNAIIFEANKLGGTPYQYFYPMIEAGAITRIVTVLEFPNGVKLTINSYPFVMGDSNISNDAIDKIWDFCNTGKFTIG